MKCFKVKNIFLFALFAGIAVAVNGQDVIDTSTYVKGNPNIYAILISQNNKIIKSEFYNGYNDESLFNDQSLTKSICSLLIGIAIEKHFISSVDEKLVDFFPELKADTDKRKQEITLREVMNQASGFYHEDLPRLDLFLAQKDPSELVLRSPLADDPGKNWYYNNAASHLFSVILTKTTHMDTRAFAEKYLFGPMGIDKFEWAKMADGYYDGSGLLSIRLRASDLLKIGKMIMDGGQYDGRQVVPQNWIKLIMTPDIAYNATWGFHQSTYALCWYHTNFKGTAITYGMGWGGQFVVLIPSLNAVVVINENIADANAVNQSIAFTTHIFPLIFEKVLHSN